MAVMNRIGKLCSQFNNVLLKNNSLTSNMQRYISTSKSCNGLMAFFDDKKNWGVKEVKCGRSWKEEELRLKSNSDLHKLWYVLLKERNMLLTMEEESNEQIRIFPNPERIDKVEESMKNLETVVRERNKAYHQLETGETGERPTAVVTSPLGMKYLYKYREHETPKYLKSGSRKDSQAKVHQGDLEKFLLKYRERLYLEKRRKNTRDLNHVIGLLKRFPDMDMQALKEQYPNVDLERARNSRKCRGHFVPK